MFVCGVPRKFGLLLEKSVCTGDGVLQTTFILSPACCTFIYGRHGEDCTQGGNGWRCIPPPTTTTRGPPSQKKKKNWCKTWGEAVCVYVHGRDCGCVKSERSEKSNSREFGVTSVPSPTPKPVRPPAINATDLLWRQETGEDVTMLLRFYFFTFDFTAALCCALRDMGDLIFSGSFHAICGGLRL